MQNVLIVDDEKSFLLSLEAGLESFGDQFQVLTAGNGKEAVEILKDRQVDFVVTDLRMPEMDGFDLLAYLAINHPQTPVSVMTAYGAPDIEQKLKMLGIVHTLDKPVGLDELASTILEGLNIASQGGTISGVSMGGFMQLIEMEQKSCRLEVETPSGRKGVFTFDRGVLADAEWGSRRGEKAALEMLTWDGAAISFRPLPDQGIPRRINVGLMGLLMEAARLKDERKGAGGDRSIEPDKVEAEESLFEAEPADSFEEAEPPGAVELDSELNEVLCEMSQELEGLILTCVLDREGRAPAFFNPGGLNLGRFTSALLGLIRSSTGNILDLDELGELQESLLMTGQAWLMLRALTVDNWLIVAVKRESTLGHVRLVAAKYNDRLVEALFAP